jgi:hypothetical protein
MSKQAGLIGLSLMLAGLVLLFFWIRHGVYWKIDACLDSGGAWDRSAKECRR